MRFKVVELEEAKEYDEYVCEWDENDGRSYLLDTKTNEIVFSDAMEPEDATLGRALKPLVDLLNKTRSM